LNKRQKIASVAIAVVYCLLYFLLGTVPIVTFYVPQFNAYLLLSVWIFVVFYILFVFSPVFQRVLKFEYTTLEWMRLHFILSFVEPSCIVLQIVPMVILFLTLKIDSNVQLFLLIWYLSFAAGLPILFQRIKNTLGMHYIKIGIPSLNGVVGFAELSILAFGRKQRKGLDYLWQALFVLQQNLRHENKDLKDLDETLAAVETISSFRQRIPYEQLSALASELVKLPALGDIPQALHSFRMSKEIEWTQAFSELPIKKRRERLTSFLERYILPIALVVVTLLGILPENMRTQATDFLQKLQWMQIVGFLVLFFLVYELGVIIGRLTLLEVEHDDIGELSNIRSTPREQIISPTFKPLEVKLADVLFIAIRKHLMVFKDLTASRHVHYTMVMNGSLINLHQTLENQHKHIPLLEIEFDWQFLMGRVFQEMRRNWRSIFQIVKTDDPKWADLEVDFIPAKVGMELFSPLVKGIRWNVDMKFLEKLDAAFGRSRLGELADSGLIIGTGSGHLVISNGIDCVLFDMDKMSNIIERSFKSSITRVRLRSLTPRLIWGYFKMRLLVLNNSVVKHLRKL
jgi:hypothetical protein